MATKTATKAAPKPQADEPAPLAAAHPPHPMTIWGWTRHAATVTGKPQGLMQVDNATGEALIASNDAVRADGRTRYPYREGFEPYNPTPPVPPPVVVSITAFSAGNPTIATASAGDLAKLSNGDAVKLAPTAGDPAAQAAIANKTGTVANKGGINFDLTGVDLTGITVSGLTATGTVQVVAAPPPAPPAPARAASGQPA